MNLAGSLGCGGAFGDGPGATFILASGKEGLEAKQVVGETDRAVERRLLGQAKLGAELGGFPWLHRGEFSFDLGAECRDRDAVDAVALAELGFDRGGVRELILADVDDQQLRQPRDESVVA